MALRKDAEDVRDKADRIVRIITFAQLNQVKFQDDDDLTLTLTPAMKLQLQNKVDSLVSEIKSIVVGW